LYVEHAPAARGLALSMVPPDVADDIVAEAFARVLAAIRAGGGPDHAFRPYLLAAVRNLANDWIAARRRVTVIGDMGEEPGDRSAPLISGFSRDAATEAEDRAEARLIVRAFSRLPERWRTVLWHLEVEGKSPADVAPTFGLSSNGVSALAVRAREGLRQAYLQEHIRDRAYRDGRRHGHRARRDGGQHRRQPGGHGDRWGGEHGGQHRRHGDRRGYRSGRRGPGLAGIRGRARRTVFRDHYALVEHGLPDQVEADVGQLGEGRLLSGLPGDKREDEQPETVDESRLEQLAYQRQAADGAQVGVPGLQPADGPDEVIADGRVRPGDGPQGPGEHCGGRGHQAGRALIVTGFGQRGQRHIRFPAHEVPLRSLHLLADPAVEVRAAESEESG